MYVVLPVYSEKTSETHKYRLPKVYIRHSFPKYCFLFGRVPLYPADIFTSHRPLDLGPPIWWSLAISDHPRSSSFSAQYCRIADVVPGVRGKFWLYQAASDTNRACTKSSPIKLRTALPFQPASSRRYCHTSVTSAPISPLFRHVCHFTRPRQPTHKSPHHPAVLDLTNDVMLTSPMKKTPKTNFSIFRAKIIFFLISHWTSTVSPAWCLRCFPPTSRNWSPSCYRRRFSIISNPKPRKNQVFTISSVQPGFQSSTVKKLKLTGQIPLQL